jgi:hypothetical protein
MVYMLENFGMESASFDVALFSCATGHGHASVPE